MPPADRLPILRLAFLLAVAGATLLLTWSASLLGLWELWPELVLCGAISLSPLAARPSRILWAPALVLGGLAGGLSLGWLGLAPPLAAASLAGAVLAYDHRGSRWQIAQGAALSVLGVGQALLLLGPSSGEIAPSHALILGAAVGTGTSLGLIARWLPKARPALPTRLSLLLKLDTSHRPAAWEAREICRQLMVLEPSLADELIGLAHWFAQAQRDRQGLDEALRHPPLPEPATDAPPEVEADLQRLEQERAEARQRQADLGREVDHALCTLRIALARLKLPTRAGPDPKPQLADLLPALRDRSTDREAQRRASLELARL